MPLTTTEVTICNSALIKLGAERINSLSETNKRARLCNEQYSKLRDEVLRSHPWNFAIKRVALASTGVKPLFDYDYEFTIPTDVLRIISLHDKTIKWRIEAGRKLLSDSSEVNIEYIAQVTAAAEFDTYFAEALALRLASDLAYPLVQSLNLQNSMLQRYELHMKNARSLDAQEGTPSDLIDDTWVEIRL